MSGQYEQTGSAADVDVQQLNPYSDALTQQLMGTTGMQQFMNMFPQIQKMIQGMTDPYKTGRLAQADIMGQQVQQDIASQFADIGALRSSASMQSIAKGVGQVRSEAMLDILGKEMGLMGQFGTAGMESIGQERSMLAQLAKPEYYVYEPTYAYKPGFLDYFASLLGSAGQAAGGAAAAYTAFKP